jgi:predicted helicase
LNVARARQRIREETNLDQFIKPLLYRPFDVRPVFYHESLIWGMARPVMQHMTGGQGKPNLALITSRMTKGESFQHVFVSRTLSEVILLSSKTSNNAFAFPLYVYPTEKEIGFGETAASANYSSEFVEDCANRLQLKWILEGAGDLIESFGPEDLFHYIYAVFNSPMYRSRYAEFLKSDFPRVPLTTDTELFRTLCDLGSKVVALHLLDSVESPPHWNLTTDGATLYEIAKVDAGFPKYEDGKVFINKSAWFDGVSNEVWNFHIGGYQVCEKWLKVRKGRTLSPEDIAHYGKITVALRETIRLMSEIDEVIEAHGGFPLPGSVPQDKDKDKE